MNSSVKDLLSPDGKYHCDQPDCEVTYELPQHMGLHRLHTHGIEGQSRDRPRKKASTNGAQRVGRPRKMLPAEDVCSTVLAEVAYNGSIPISAIDAYLTWIKATETFLNALGESRTGKP